MDDNFLILLLINLIVVIQLVRYLDSRLWLWCIHLFSLFILLNFLQSSIFILNCTNLLFFLCNGLSLNFSTCLIAFPIESPLCFRLWLWSWFPISTKNIYFKFWRFWSDILNILFWNSSFKEHRKSWEVSCTCIKEKLSYHL